MAEESPVENLLMPRYFCHHCKVEVSDILPDYNCPTCHSGFVEILEVPPENNDESDSSDVETNQPFELLNYVLMGLNGGGFDDRLGHHRREVHRSGRSGRNRQMAPVEHLLQDFIVNLANNGGFGTSPASRAPVANGPVPGNLIGTENSNVENPLNVIQSILIQTNFNLPGNVLQSLFLGNPGDYAWGRDGLDAIVTQLLNQMDGTGPPPLAKDKIQEIPVVYITQDQVDSNLQCSVCWEDFKVNDPVKKLACEHVYHSPCIVPWLELHGTCPICRKTLNEGDSSEEATNASAAVNSVVSPLTALLRTAGDPITARLFTSSPSSSASNSSTSSGSTSSSSSSSSSSSRGQDFMDFQ